LSNYEGGFLGLKEGLLALMEALPGNPPDWLAADQEATSRPKRTKSLGAKKR
jgi:hypothetical protein